MAEVESMFSSSLGGVNNDSIMDADDESSGDEQTNSGWADAMSKILGKQNIPKPIMAKGKKDKDIKPKKVVKDKVEVVTEDNSGTRTKVDNDDEGSDEDDEEEGYDPEQKLKKRLWNEMGRVKPDVVDDRERERKFQKVATKGVVQLFNAVKKQQNMVEDKLKQAGSSETKKSKVMKSINKGDFLDMLKGTKTNVSTEPIEQQEKNTSEELNQSSEGKEKPKWNVLRDDFMIGAKMKDWDKDSGSENGEEGDAD